VYKTVYMCKDFMMIKSDYCILGKLLKCNVDKGFQGITDTFRTVLGTPEKPCVASSIPGSRNTFRK